MSVPYSPVSTNQVCHCIRRKQSSWQCSVKPQPRSSHPRDIHKPQLKAYFGWGFTLCIAHVQPGFPQSCTAQADRPPWGHVDNSPILPGLPCSMGIFGHYSVVIRKRRRRLWPMVRQKCGVNWGNIELCTARAAWAAQNRQGGNCMICTTFIKFAIFPKSQPVDNIIR